MLALLLLQTAPPAAAAAPPERFSILVPTASQPCPPRAERRGEEEGDVVVCATDMPAQTLPYPDEYVGSRPRPSNPELTGAGALAASATPCAATQWGCQVGFGQPLVAAAVKGLVGLVKDATAKKPDRRGRVPIDIGEPVKKAP